ncbi:paraquat-inducible protein A [Thalassotalea ponticola]|uniref:paraquat-inducible protein A n=1 Tax=Thalassotalea ponticola TaxID=1523392 RepID=UPI0025B34D2D|nr:paraquat-inducible protein A [Thalassotalea ponticola]MDN3651512.1 paraquat-inducible protein A [Thalassotalea ponticola]
MLQRQYACIACDALVDIQSLKPGQVAKCPRCQHVILTRKYNPINSTIALCLSGLILYLPAVFYPLMSLQVLSVESSASLYSGIHALWQSELYIVACLVFIFCALTPLVKLIAALLVSVGVKYQQTHHNWYRRLLVYYIRADSWEMLEVFLIGILVSIFKLRDMATLHYDLGLLCFCLLMLCVVSLKVTMDKQLIWDHVDAR